MYDTVMAGTCHYQFSSVESVVSNSFDPMNRSTPALPVHHQLPETTQTHVHWVSDGIQPFHPLLSPSPPALNLSQHQGLCKWVSSSHQVPKVLEFQLQHPSFQWTPRTCHYTYVQTHRLYNTKDEPYGHLWTWVIMMCQCRFFSYN